MKVNNKLKGIYFVWGDKYYAPFPRSFDDTFEHYLYFSRYEEFGDENWQQKIMDECGISSKEEYDAQIQVIEADYEKYSEQKSVVWNRKQSRILNRMHARCRKEGILPF